MRLPSSALQIVVHFTKTGCTCLKRSCSTTSVLAWAQSPKAQLILDLDSLHTAERMQHEPCMQQYDPVFLPKHTCLADMGFDVQFSGGILRTIVEHRMAA